PPSFISTHYHSDINQYFKIMGFKVIKNIVHSRKTGQKDSEGKDKYISTQIGCIMQDGDKMIMKMNYYPSESEAIFNLYTPKKREEPTLGE
ncbi:MAG: hypothetical protein ACXADH_03125, partial [Candidatus Kariarchaeaceae archaeon]